MLVEFDGIQMMSAEKLLALYGPHVCSTVAVIAMYAPCSAARCIDPTRSTTESKKATGRTQAMLTTSSTIFLKYDYRRL